MTIFDQIRQAARDVADRADRVTVDDERLESYADELPVEEVERPERDDDLHYFGHGDATVAYVVTLDTINFGSGYFPWTQPRDGHTDYAMVATSLTERFERQGPIPPEQLVELTTEDCGELFAQEIQHDARRKLMASYAHCLGKLGEHLIEEYDGSYVALVEDADGSAARLVERLAEIPSFRDEVVYKNVDVPFYKRAQIMAMDLYLAFEGDEWGDFEDIDQLTLFADNRVPHVLRLDGVLAYEEALADRVDGRELLPAGSPGEIEIRACAVDAVERLSEALEKRGEEVPPRLLDNYLWHRGQQDRYRVRPAHLTQSVYY
ncbi:MAG: queuosine salvage family protein [Bradymonadaceae bacterium]